jgi:hypothetical protein
MVRLLPEIEPNSLAALRGAAWAWPSAVQMRASEVNNAATPLFRFELTLSFLLPLLFDDHRRRSPRECMGLRRRSFV